MLLSELLTEVHWTDSYPKPFQDFRSKYLKAGKAGYTKDLYIQFTNFADNKLDRTAFANPDHSDPVGTYGYFMEYVLKHPSDIWYGRSAKYLRVLKSTYKNPLYLATVDNENKIERILSRMGFTRPQINDSIWNAKKYLKKRLTGSNKFAKMFLSTVQLDLTVDPDSISNGVFSGEQANFRTRTGAEQTALFLKAGFDALIDMSKTANNAIMNAREPEQIIFLNRNAFTVEDVFFLRPNAETSKSSMTSVDPDKLGRPLAAAFALVMGDKISEYAGDKKTREGLDASYNYYWTKFGRRIEIDFERPQSYYTNKNMGEKKHRSDKLSDAYCATIDIVTEYGTIKHKFGSNDTFKEMASFVQAVWANISNGPKVEGWVPESSASFAQKKKDIFISNYEKKRAKELEKLGSEWPKLLSEINEIASRYGVEFTQHSKHDFDIANDLGYLASIYRNSSGKDMDDVFKKWKDELSQIDSFDVQHAEITEILKKAAKEFSPRDFFSYGSGMFMALRRLIGNKSVD